jgi:RNA polymerase sigma-70 factor (ECF subfamily)
VEKSAKTEEAALVKMLIHRDPESVGILYDKYAAASYGVIRRIIFNDAIAEEILAESFVKAIENINHYNPSRLNFCTWLLNISRNLSLERMRKENTLNNSYGQAIDQILQTGDSMTSLHYQREPSEVNEAGFKIAVEYKVIIDLLFLRGLSQHDTARKLNIPLGTVRTRSHAAINKFKAVFSENKIEE